MPATKLEKTFCEFFAGIGLVHEALHRTGWKAIYANDIDAKKRLMYEGNYGTSPHYHLGDVHDTEEVLARIKGQPTLATASFPCTDMSLAGKRRGLAGEQSGALFGFLKVLEGLGKQKPRIVLLENVPGFLTSQGGTDFDSAISELASLGYWLDGFVVDARWFVPQSRPRLFMVGYHDDIASLPIFRRSIGAETSRANWIQALRRAENIRPTRLLEKMKALEPATGWATLDCQVPVQEPYSLEAVLSGDSDEKWWPRDQVRKHKRMMHARHIRKLEEQAEDTGKSVATAFRRIRSGAQKLELRFDGVAGCLRTPRGGSAKQIVVAYENRTLRMRWMTPAEYAELQGAKGFILPTSKIQGYFGFGDAVCVPAIEWIDQQFLTPVFQAAAKPRRSKVALST